MAVATYLGMVPVIMFLALTLGRLLQNWNFVLNNLVFNAFVVAFTEVSLGIDKWLWFVEAHSQATK